jgi:uncharacterized protein
MKYNWFESASPGAKIILMFMVMFVCVMMAFVLSVYVAAPFMHKTASELFDIAKNLNSSDYNFLKYLQTVQAIALFIIPAMLLPAFFGSNYKEYLSLKKIPSAQLIILAIVFILIAVPFINFTEMVNSKMKLPQALSGLENWMKTSEHNAAVLSEGFLKVNTIGALLFNLFMMAVLPAIGEEFVFRGVFQKLLTQCFKNYHWGIIASAALFSFFHFQFYGFVPRMLLGMAFGYMLVWSGSLWVPITAHFINNAMGVIFYFLFYRKATGDALLKAGTDNHGYIYAIVSLVCVLFLLGLFHKYSKNLQENKLQHD